MGLGSRIPLPSPLWEASPCHYRQPVEGWWLVHGVPGGRGPEVGWRGLRGLLWARLVCRGDNVFPGGELLLHDWGLCPWDLCLPSTPPLPCGQVKGRREEGRTAGLETPPPAPQQD